MRFQSVDPLVDLAEQRLDDRDLCFQLRFQFTLQVEHFSLPAERFDRSPRQGNPAGILSAAVADSPVVVPLFAGQPPSRLDLATHEDPAEHHDAGQHHQLRALRREVEHFDSLDRMREETGPMASQGAAYPLPSTAAAATFTFTEAFPVVV